MTQNDAPNVYRQRSVVLNEGEIQMTGHYVFKPSNRSKPFQLDYKSYQFYFR